jgi:hypothetical protein
MEYSARHACLRAIPVIWAAGRPGARPGRLVAGLVAMAGLTALPLTAATTASAATAAVHPAATTTTTTATASTTASGFPWLASVRPAASPLSYFLTSGQVPVRAGGRTWELSVQVSKTTLGEPGSVLIQIETPHLGGDEVHDWTFGDFPAKDLTVSASGSASASSGSSLSPMASLTLAFKPSSHQVASCAGGGRQTTYSGQLTGSVRLVTGLHKLTLTTRKVTFGRPSTLSVSTDFCVPSACSFASWSASSAKAFQPPFALAVGIQVGRPGHLLYFAEVEHLVQLSKKDEILRSDGAIIKTANPGFSKSRKTLSITTSKDGAVTGSAVIGPAKPGTPDTFTCMADGVSYRETDASYTGRFASPAGGQLEAHTLLTGVQKIGRKGTGGFDIITSLKKK